MCLFVVGSHGGVTAITFKINQNEIKPVLGFVWDSHMCVFLVGPEIFKVKAEEVLSLNQNLFLLFHKLK